MTEQITSSPAEFLQGHGLSERLSLPVFAVAIALLLTACSEPDWQQRDSVGWKVIGDDIPDVSRQPEYIIEQISATIDPGASLDSDRTISTQGYYRVTARGFGQSDRTMAVLTTTYRREEN